MSDSKPALIDMLFQMMRIRKFETVVAEKITAKEILDPCHLAIGQEAVAVGVCKALRSQDYMFCHHRGHGHYLAKGGSMDSLMAELYCKSTGCSHGKGGSMHSSSPEINFVVSPIVGGTIPLAVGTALASKIKDEDTVSVSVFGDGAVAEGSFYESINFASLKHLPVIFLCENNLYCTHMSIKDCLANEEIYKTGQAFNMKGRRIDGNDVTIVYEEMASAVHDALDGKPTILECMTYRSRGHVGPNFDLEKGLRSMTEVEIWTLRDPITKLATKMLNSGLLTNKELEDMGTTIDNEVQDAINFAQKSSYPKSSKLYEDVWA